MFAAKGVDFIMKVNVCVYIEREDSKHNITYMYMF